MKKVAYIGPYKDGTGYSTACLESIIALDKVEVKVSPRYVRMTNKNWSDNIYKSKITELEANNLQNIDAVFQHNLPSEFSYIDGVKNIGVFSYETNSIINSGWINNLELMNTIVVASKFEENILKNELHKNIEVKHIPFATNVDKYDNALDRAIDLGLPQDCVKFYSVSELNKRKNLETLIISYSSAFDSGDNVALIIKINGGEKNKNILIEIIQQIRGQLKRFKDINRYPKIIILSDFVSEQQMMRLHANFDVFISASHGESHCFPLIDAMGVGNAVIVPRHTVFLDHVEFPWQGRFVNCSKTFCFGANDSLPNLYTSEESWSYIDQISLAQQMIWMYDNKEFLYSSTERQNRKEYVKDKFNHITIGEKLKALI